MKKQLLLALSVAMAASSSLYAQIPVKKGVKLDAGTERFVKTAATAATVSANGETPAPQLQAVIISCTDATAVLDLIAEAGYEGKGITETIVTAELPATVLTELSQSPAVRYVSLPTKVKPTMDKARQTTHADEVQAGTGLETPFTGKDVVIGVIDQGFQFKHIAFRKADKSSRVLAVWNRYRNQNPTTTIPDGSDGMTGIGGHATHVTGIAAGSRVEGNNYYGMAPDADIIMVPSTFVDSEILEDAAYVKQVAESLGKPWVINMSFGNQWGPHDGTTNYDQGMSALCGPGGLMAAAMGNENGQNLHASHTFTADNEVINVLLSHTDDWNMLDLWEQTADGQQHLSVRPFVYNPLTRAKDYKDESFWNSVAYIGGEINPNNNKEHYEIQISMGTFDAMSGVLGRNPLFGVEITGNTGDSFHCWSNGYGEFTRLILADGGSCVVGNSDYTVGGGAACIPRAVSVSSYNSTNESVSLADGYTYTWSVGDTGDLSSFSSIGPFLGAEPKPTVAGPGAMVSSAISTYDGFSATDAALTSVVDGNGKAATLAMASLNRNAYNFYGVKSGTSMATPAVAGILALWLQANPTLSYEQVKEILRTTSTKDSFTGSEEWNARFGYGKINAYEGLKKALEMAQSSGINETLNSEAPVTLLKGAKEWRVLFNSNETFADVYLYSLSGAQVRHDRLNNVRRGDEHTVSFSGMQPGVYLIRINTTSSTLTRKVAVE